MMNKYQSKNGSLIKEKENPILDLKIEDVTNISDEAADWLRLKRYIKNLISNLANGEGGSPQKIRDFVYYLLHPVPRFWDRNVEDLNFDGPYTAKLKSNLNKIVDIRDIYDCLCDLEYLLEEVPSDLKTRQKQYELDEYKSRSTDPNILRHIQTRSENLRGTSVYLHGSMATQDYTPFSDIDDFVVVSRSSWSDFKTFTRNIDILHTIAKSFYKYDPIQHHGHWIFTHFDLQCFNPAQMPPSVLEYSLRMTGEKNLTISVLDDRFVYYRPLWSMVQTIRHTLTQIEDGCISMYRLKKLISSISLMPALLAQLDGREWNKKTAINNSHTILPEESLDGLKWATKIRQNWEQIPHFRKLVLLKSLNKFSPFNRVVAEEIGKRYAPSLQSEEIPYLENSVIESIWKLSDCGADAILEVVQ